MDKFWSSNRKSFKLVTWNWTNPTIVQECGDYGGDCSVAELLHLRKSGSVRGAI